MESNILVFSFLLTLFNLRPTSFIRLIQFFSLVLSIPYGEVLVFLLRVLRQWGRYPKPYAGSLQLTIHPVLTLPDQFHVGRVPHIGLIGIGIDLITGWTAQTGTTGSSSNLGKNH